VGFVDVPGHERFVRNMLAGVGGIDMVLLVIAADEGVKPQTREHFDILKLLGVQRGLTVLTKSDALDAETIEVVRWEVEEFLRGTFLDKPDSVLTVSSLTGVGIQELKLALAVAASEVPLRDSLAIARLPIDRVFTMKGFGTVVTGTLVSGTIRHEDELEVFPINRRMRVRGVQVHGRSADQTVAGQRTAVNLAGASTQDLSRGMTLAPPATFATTRRVDVRLRLLPSAPHALKDRARVHFHSYTMEAVVEILLRVGKGSDASVFKDAQIPSTQLLAGEEQFARIRLPEPALLLPGDRFIIRQFSPVVTIGGGTVLDAAPIPRMAGRVEFLTVLSGENNGASLLARIGRRRQNGITVSELVSETGWTKSVIEKHLAPALQQGHVLRAGDRVIHGPAFAGLQHFIIRTIEAFQKENPLVSGIAKEELRKRVGSLSDVFEAAIGSLVREKKIEVASEVVRKPGRGVSMKDEEAESKLRIEKAFASAGLQVPALADVLAGLKIDRVRAQKIVTLLLREKLLIKVSDELVFHRSALEQLRERMAAYKSKSAKIDVAQFKSLTGVTRKYAIPLLEYLDRERVTKRIGDAREIL
ncbi:MAG: selenocysteine-specific translation elongation factor, partial [Candidatus Sulfotelmatobacter sp.]